MQCFLFYTIQDPFKLQWFKIVLFTLSPIMKTILISFIIIVRALIKKEENLKKKVLMRIGVVLVGLIILEQSGIIGALCDYLSCIRLDPSDETRYVTTNPNVQCGTASYNLFRNFFVIPALLVWGFLI